MGYKTVSLGSIRVEPENKFMLLFKGEEMRQENFSSFVVWHCLHAIYGFSNNISCSRGRFYSMIRPFNVSAFSPKSLKVKNHE